MTEINLAAIELKLQKMKRINQQKKELEAEYKIMKEDIIKDYFLENPEFKNEKGLVLAQYTKFVKMKFDGKKFKSDFPDIYSEYQYPAEERNFLLK